MKKGDLVRHFPKGSEIEIILRKIDGVNSDGELDPDFQVGIIIDESSSGKKSRVLTPENGSTLWYENKELRLIV